MKTNRGFFKYFFLSIITLGIYGIVCLCHVGDDVNVVCKKDGKKTMNYALMTFLVTPITLGIAQIVWWHRISKRMGREIERRNISYSFGAGSYWLWNTIGLLLFGLGPIIYMVKFFKAINLLNEDYNKRIEQAKILKKKQELERQRLIKQNNTLVKNLNNAIVAQENVNVKPIPYEDIMEFEDDEADLEEYEE